MTIPKNVIKAEYRGDVLYFHDVPENQELVEAWVADKITPLLKKVIGSHNNS